MITGMLGTLPEVKYGLSACQNGDVAYPSAYYHPMIQYVVTKIISTVVPDLRALLGEKKAVHYVPDALVYMDNTGEMFPSDRRRRMKTFFRRTTPETAAVPGARHFTVYMNMNKTRTMVFDVAERSHLDTGEAATSIPTSMSNNHRPFMDNEGRCYTSIQLHPEQVLVIDGRMVEYVHREVPPHGTGLFLTFSMVVTEEDEALFDNYNVRAIADQSVPRRVASAGTAPASLNHICQKSIVWLEQNLHPDFLKAATATHPMISRKAFLYPSLKEVGLPLWPIQNIFAATLQGLPMSVGQRGAKRAREE